MEKLKVPKLRFKEFSGEWEENILGNIGKVSMCKRIMKEQTTPTGDIPFYKIGTFGRDPDSFITKEIFEDFKARFSFPKKGDILISASGTIGRTVIYDGKPAYFQDSNIVWIDNYEVLVKNEFLLYCYSIIRWTTEDTTIARLYNDNLKNMKLFFPSLLEQQKIADFLSKVDEKIEKLTKKKELLEQYKKGVMQKIFSQEIRFKDDNGNDFPEWEEKELGEVTNIYDGTHQTPNYVDEGIPFYSVEHVTANQFINTKFITQEIFEEENKRVKLEKGDILMTRIGSIGKVRCIDWDVKASFYVSLAMIKNNKTFNSLFLSYFMQTDFFQKELWDRTIHVAFPKKINLGEIGNCRVNLPSLPEQQKIADFLSALDKKIDIVDKELARVQEFKKGLLQQMFV